MGRWVGGKGVVFVLARCGMAEDGSWVGCELE
jgi:hypothetical protein